MSQDLGGDTGGATGGDTGGETGGETGGATGNGLNGAGGEDLGGGMHVPEGPDRSGIPGQVGAQAAAQGAAWASELVTDPAVRARPRRRVGLWIGIGVAAVLILGAGAAAAAWTWLRPDDPQPLAEVLPSGTVAYGRLDLDPSAGQKVALARLASSLPASLRTGSADTPSWQDALDDALQGSGIDVAAVSADVQAVADSTTEVAVAALGTGDDQVVVLVASRDPEADRAAIERIVATASRAGGSPDAVRVGQRGDWLVVGAPAAVAALDGAGGRLVDLPGHVAATSGLPDEALATLWVRSTDGRPDIGGSVAATSSGLALDAATTGPGFAQMLGASATAVPPEGLLGPARASTRTYLAVRGGPLVASDLVLLEVVLSGMAGGTPDMGTASTSAIDDATISRMFGWPVPQVRSADTLVAFAEQPLTGLAELADEFAAIPGQDPQAAAEARTALTDLAAAVGSASIVVSGNQAHVELALS